MNSKFKIDFTSHDDYEYLAAEIYFEGQRLCQMFRHTNDDSIDIEFIEDRLLLHPPVKLRFPLSQFLEAVNVAKNELLALKR
jgi:hypothetical protein